MIGKTAAMTAVVLALAMAVAGFALVADSADAEGQMSMSVTGELVDAGETAEIGIEVSNNPGFEAMEFGVTYDAAVLEYVEGSITLGSEFTAQGMEIIRATVEDGRVTIILAYGGQGHANMTGDGRLVTLQFTVAAGAAAGLTDVGLSLSGLNDMILNMDLDDVPCTLVPGVVDVIGYDIVFTVDGQTFSSDELSLGSVITAPAQDPVKEPADGVQYTFSGWEGYTEGMTVTGDMTFAAVFTEREVGQYTVSFVVDPEGSASVVCDGAAVTSAIAYEGDEIQVSGNEIVIGGTSYTVTVAESDAQYTYGAVTIDAVTGPVTDDVTVTIGVQRTVNTYTVTWQYADGTVIATQQDVQYGTVPVFDGEDPSMDGYKFVGWDAEASAVTGNTVYTAVFAKIVTVAIVSNDASMGTVSQSEVTAAEGTPIVSDVAAGTLTIGDVTVTATPAQATVENTYVLSAWSYEGTAVAEGMTVTAVFAPKAQEYTITWLDEDGTTVRVDTLEYGDDIVPPVVSKEPTDQYTYEFAGWKGYTEDMTVTGDATFTAEYTETLRSYTVSFVCDGETVYSDILYYGDDIVAPADPVKEPTDQYTYEFAGWKGYTEDMTVTGDAEFEAVFDRTPVDYTVIFVVYGADVSAPAAVRAGYGTTVSIPDMPAVSGYTLEVFVDGTEVSGGSFTMPAEDVLVTFVYSEVEVVIPPFFDEDDTPVVVPPYVPGTGTVTEASDDDGSDDATILACAIAAVAAVLLALFAIVERKK